MWLMQNHTIRWRLCNRLEWSKWPRTKAEDLHLHKDRLQPTRTPLSNLATLWFRSALSLHSKSTLRFTFTLNLIMIFGKWKSERNGSNFIRSDQIWSKRLLPSRLRVLERATENNSEEEMTKRENARTWKRAI